MQKLKTFFFIFILINFCCYGNFRNKLGETPNVPKSDLELKLKNESHTDLFRGAIVIAKVSWLFFSRFVIGAIYSYDKKTKKYTVVLDSPECYRPRWARLRRDKLIFVDNKQNL
ncbi:hypothetical protein HN446_05215 [bacterium]|jgi:hypothetical protein|nr:hypothetical protein [bacterium]